jgi:hypothetical protein
MPISIAYIPSKIALGHRFNPGLGKVGIVGGLSVARSEVVNLLA